MLKLLMPPIPVQTSRVLFDVSRLLRSRQRAFATGVDRIDLALGLDLLLRFGERCDFLYAGSAGVAVLRHETGRQILTTLDAKWNGAAQQAPRSSHNASYASEIFLRSVTRRDIERVATSDTTYVVASHSGLGKIPGGMQKLDPQKAMKRLIYIHDIIPIEMPEYQRPETRPAFEAYLGELVREPATIASNSHDTDARFRALAQKRDWPIVSFVVLKPEIVPVSPAQGNLRSQVSSYLRDDRPFFTVIGTIEPRKNHLLLLNVWREMAQGTLPPPRLCLIGKRGWENENVLDMLDRCDAIRDSVTEFGDLSDGEVQMMMKASRALLFPSFTEGLGIPLLEAAALGLPCVVSDIPVFREIAPSGTVFLDPLDGPGWKREIRTRSASIANELQA
jgi:glycosyltransferase involved in cell wall biosynthesis